MGDGDLVDVRFRHTQGDVGPFKVPASTSVQSLKDRLLIEWPKGMPAWAELVLQGPALLQADTFFSTS